MDDQILDLLAFQCRFQPITRSESLQKIVRKVPEVIIETVEDEQEEPVELQIEKVEEEARQVRRKELEEYLDGLRLQVKILTEQKELEVLAVN